jgi:hypothetical protein
MHWCLPSESERLNYISIAVPLAADLRSSHGCCVKREHTARSSQLAHGQRSGGAARRAWMRDTCERGQALTCPPSPQKKNYIVTESYITPYYPVLHLPREHNYIHVINGKLFHVTDEKQSPTILHKIRVQSPWHRRVTPRCGAMSRILHREKLPCGPFSLGSRARTGC